MDLCLAFLAGVLTAVAFAPLLRWWWTFRRHPRAEALLQGKAPPPYSVIYQVGDDRRVAYWSPDLGAAKKQFHIPAPAGTVVEFWEADHCRGRRLA